MRNILGWTKSDKKKRLYRLIDLYSSFIEIVDRVKELTIKVEKIKLLKNIPEEEGN